MFLILELGLSIFPHMDFIFDVMFKSSYQDFSQNFIILCLTVYFLVFSFEVTPSGTQGLFLPLDSSAWGDCIREMNWGGLHVR